MSKSENYSLHEYKREALICDVGRFFELCGRNAEYENAHTLHLDDYDRLSESELSEYLSTVCGQNAVELSAKQRSDNDLIKLFSGRGISMRKLLPLFGIKPVSDKKAPQSQSKPVPEQKPSEQKSRDLSVWLL